MDLAAKNYYKKLNKAVKKTTIKYVGLNIWGKICKAGAVYACNRRKPWKYARYPATGKILWR